MRIRAYEDEDIHRERGLEKAISSSEGFADLLFERCNDKTKLSRSIAEIIPPFFSAECEETSCSRVDTAVELPSIRQALGRRPDFDHRSSGMLNTRL